MGILGSRLGITRYEADEHYRKALNYYLKKNLDEAVHSITAAIELFPNRAEYYAARGMFRLADGLPDEAEPDFDTALQFHAYEMLANYGKGAIAFQRDEHTTARDYLMKAWAIDQKRPEILYYLALIEHRLKNNLKALDWMQKAAALYQPLTETDREARTRKKNVDKWIAEFSKQIKASM